MQQRSINRRTTFMASLPGTIDDLPENKPSVNSVHVIVVLLQVFWRQKWGRRDKTHATRLHHSE